MIGLYLEDVKEGRAFFDLLRSAKATKPVVILKGGRSQQGRLAAASHTGALAGDDRAWEALAEPVAGGAGRRRSTSSSTRCSPSSTSTPRPAKPTQQVALFGNGGGSSVLGTDAFADVGLDVSPFEPAVRARLEALKLPPGTSVANPIDTPVRTLQEKDGWVAGEILDIVYEDAKPDAVAMHLNLAAFVGRGEVDPLDNLLRRHRADAEEMAGRRPFRAGAAQRRLAATGREEARLSRQGRGGGRAGVRRNSRDGEAR